MGDGCRVCRIVSALGLGFSTLLYACGASPTAPLPPCTSPRVSITPSLSPDLVEAARRYESLVNSTSPTLRDFNRRIALDEASNNVAAERLDLGQRMEFGRSAEQRLIQIPFPAAMEKDETAYVAAIHSQRKAAQEFIDAPDNESRAKAVHDMNVANRVEENVINRVRADLGLTLQVCPYQGP